MTSLDQTFHDALLRARFDLFLRRCLLTLNPESPFLPNWHISAIAHRLERIRRGACRRAI